MYYLVYDLQKTTFPDSLPLLCGLSSPENTVDSDRKLIADLISRMAETTDTSHLRSPAFYINALSKVTLKDPYEMCMKIL